LAVIVGMLLSFVAGCAGSSSQEQQKAYKPNIDPTEFTTTIDNEYFPMKPGTTFIYQGGAEHTDPSRTQWIIEAPRWDNPDLF
jgi:hypothetical protein